MTIEVTSTSICSGIVRIYGIDCSEENLQRMERIRDDGTEREVVFVFDTKMIKNLLNICPVGYTVRRSRKRVRPMGKHLKRS